MSYPAKVCLIIGVDAYNSLGALPCCKKDAEDMSELLLAKGFTNFSNSPIIGSKIINERYPCQVIREAITRFFTEAKPDQLLLFYFSGHGAHSDRGEVYLATPDLDPKNPRTRGFSLEELTDCIDDCVSDQRVVILDACYAGKLGLPNPKKAANDEAQNALVQYQELIKEQKEKQPADTCKETAYLLSSQAYQQSNAQGASENSTYTKFLIEGIRGKPSTEENGRKIKGSIDEEGNVTPQSLHRYIHGKVASLDVGQEPKCISDETKSIVIASYCKSTLSPNNSLLPSQKISNNPYCITIEKKAQKVKATYEKFMELSKLAARTTQEKETTSELEKISTYLARRYADSEAITDEAKFFMDNYQKGVIQLAVFNKKMYCLSKDISRVEFEIDGNVAPKIERIGSTIHAFSDKILSDMQGKITELAQRLPLEKSEITQTQSEGKVACPQCGLISEGETFCPNCQSRLKEGATRFDDDQSRRESWPEISSTYQVSSNVPSVDQTPKQQESFQQPSKIRFSHQSIGVNMSIVGVWRGETPIVKFNEEYKFSPDRTWRKTVSGMTTKNMPFTSILEGIYRTSDSELTIRTTQETHTPEDKPVGAPMVTELFAERQLFAFTLKDNGQTLVLEGLNVNAKPHSITLYKDNQINYDPDSFGSKADIAKLIR